MKTQFKEWSRAFFRQHMVEFFGYFFLGLGAYFAIALASYSRTDPSLNRATDEAIVNWGGLSGAYFADLVLQLLGLGGILLILLPLGWGFKLLVQRRLPRISLRIGGTLFALPGFAALLAFAPAPISWPIETGLGGYVGAYSKIWVSGMVGHIAAFAVLLLWTLLMAYIAFGNRIRDWRLFGDYCRRGFAFMDSGINFLRGLRGEQELVRDVKTGKTSPVKEMDNDPLPRLDTDASSKSGKKRVEAASPRKKTVEKKVAQSSFELPEGPSQFQLPPINILSHADIKAKRPTEAALEQNARLLESVLADFGVNGEITKVRPGPVVTLYELEPSAGTKSSRVIGLSDDIARSMSAISARIAVIPGRNAIGIELPNAQKEMVSLREICEDAEFTESVGRLAIALGKDIGGDPVVVDLARMPHLLVAGTTGSGKSVAINTMILSLLYRLTPEECRFIMIDPKMLELSMYDGIPHLLSPVVTEPGKAVVALKWTVKEMENRYRLMSNLGVRNIDGYNKRIIEAKSKGSTLTRTVQTGFDPDTGKPIIEEMPLDMTPLPYIVVIVDEMADLMLVAGKDIEASIQRLAQMARAAGIHIIMATQRPSVDVITGVIKANFPTRISFQVTSRIDSRTILGEQGAETLLGQGDMLYMAGGGRITRVHGPFVSDQEVETVVAFLKAQGEPEYIETITQEEGENGEFGLEGGGGSEEDDLYRQAVQVVMRDKKVSTSYIQRSLRIGYNRAADLMDRMEREGIVSAPNHAGKRELLIDPDRH